MAGEKVGNVVRLGLLIFSVGILSACTVSMTNSGQSEGQAERIVVYDSAYRDLLVKVYEVLSHSPHVSGIKAVESPGLGYVFELLNIEARIVIRPVAAQDSWGRQIVGYGMDYYLSGTVLSLRPVRALESRVAPLFEIRSQLSSSLAAYRLDVSDVRYLDL